ncbi:hypothetical protein SAMN02745248_00344 [Hathewaya proteolytica DSM 3090]|uniref:Amidase domain-containing protein n=1 Tax=Hathewaya proteolytica DSM 3090 TaxID=1121331 RepID=A0A1M6K5Z3_9CLOT|nr:hypothetical protein [Hathewaya proteolytica]SHJ54260.1 hypothetical protein SAMN02745248_00344 [Hathewaya proteolytica DSM 3090]
MECKRERRKVKRRKRKFTKLLTVCITIGGIYLLWNLASNQIRSLEIPNKIYTYLTSKENRINTYNRGIELNNNSSANTCVYFVAEVLRRNDIDVPIHVANTRQLLEVLEHKGWRKDTDYKNLKPGDIAFTTDENGGSHGEPTHTYVFMEWVGEGSYEYAYICDNQAKDYDNKIYHIRNIKNVGTANGMSKDAFAFFMKPR